MLKQETKQFIFGSLFIAWSLLIIYFSVLPGDELVKLGKENTGFRWDYLEHFSVYLIFAVLLLLWRRHDSNRNKLILLLFTGIILGSTTESAQLFIPSRSFNYLDLLSNFAGLAAGLLIMKVLSGFRYKKLLD